MKPKGNDMETPRERPPAATVETGKPPVENLPKSPPSAAERLLAVSKRREYATGQSKLVRKAIEGDLNLYEMHRKKYGLPPDIRPTPASLANQERAASLDGQAAETTRKERGLRRLNSAIDSIKPMNDPTVIEKHNRLFPDPKDNPAAPQYLVIDRPKGTIFGVSHGKNPEGSTIQKLYETIPSVAEMPANLVFMVEGEHSGINREEALKRVEKMTSRDEAVKKYGESGAAFWAVKEANDAGKTVEINSPEAPNAWIIDRVSNKNAEDIALYLTLRQFTSDIGQAKDGPTAEERLEKFVRTFVHVQRTTGVDWMKNASVDEYTNVKDNPVALNSWLKKKASEFLEGMNARLMSEGLVDKQIVPDVDALINVDLERISMRDINELHSPMDTGKRDSIINKISTEWNGARDRFLVEQIAKAVDDGKKPFVIFGGAHVASIEKAVDTLLKGDDE